MHTVENSAKPVNPTKCKRCKSIKFVEEEVYVAGNSRGTCSLRLARICAGCRKIAAYLD